MYYDPAPCPYTRPSVSKAILGGMSSFGTVRSDKVLAVACCHNSLCYAPLPGAYARLLWHRVRTLPPFASGNGTYVITIASLAMHIVSRFIALPEGISPEALWPRV